MCTGTDAWGWGGGGVWGVHPVAFEGQTGLSWEMLREIGEIGFRASHAPRLHGMFLPGARDSRAGIPAPAGPLLG